MDLDQLLGLLRICARRDLTVMPAALFSLTALTCIEIAGDRRHKDWARSVVDSGQTIGFALSEPEHGSDLLHNSVTLSRESDRWRLDGSKWLVGMGVDASAVLVVARTGARGPGAFTMVLTKATADHIDYASGFRGIPLAAFTFHGDPVSEDDVVGQAGRGLETAMLAMTVVRAVSTGANLAAVDAAIEMGIRFATEHVIGRQPIIGDAQVRRELGTAAAAAMAADVVAMVCARFLHELPQAGALYGGLAKVVVPALAGEVMDRVGDTLGSRSLLTAGQYAAFDVLRRDNAVVRYVDTSPQATLRQMLLQLKQIHLTQEQLPDLRTDTVVDLRATIREFSPTELELSCRGRDQLAAAARSAVAAGTLPEESKAHALRALQIQQAALGNLSGPEAADAVESYCFAQAALAVLLTAEAAGPKGLFGDREGRYLSGVITLLLDRADGRRRRLPAALAEGPLSAAERLTSARLSLSAIPIPVAGDTTTLKE